MKYKLYDVIIECDDFFDVTEYVRGLVWDEIDYEIVGELPKYHQYRDNINGVDIYYDYGADYYFFAEDELESSDLF